MELTISEAIKLLNDNSEMNYIATVITPWHELSLEASLLYISEKYDVNPDGITMILKHGRTGYAISEDDVLLSTNVAYKIPEVSDLRGIRRVISFIKKILYCFGIYGYGNNKKKFFLITPVNTNVDIYVALRESQLDREIIPVIIDEGLATYFEDTKGWLAEQKKNGASFRGFVFYCLKDKMMAGLLKHRLEKRNKFLNCNMFIKNKQEGLSINAGVISFYKKAIDAEIEKRKLPKIDMPSKYVLINTQPFTVNESTGIDLDFDVLQTTIFAFKKCGYQVVLKPHPREKSIERYKSLDVIMIEDISLTQEVLLECFKNKPQYIISYFSTSLITANLFFGVKAISLARVLMRKESLDLTDYRRMERFLKTFGDYVIQIKDTEELNTRKF